ncbi:aromatic-ring-hydroxylating dioxygenase subunit beta [Schinkia azotoformans]|uniref:aromatic-ring-hydroxylating dioxygenase subunit beta n=1 Tax=Schinkia azotoformans TaxID=1454 RepID=UPI002DB72A41|nr:aromatic-ring-hydroxylating dioxygenase subunit beta [Schinkia azotoformans]MEC1714489.1 aromatic-ring-hydroxylating dioxygenase subunit beta [Schinkia azotoformans]MEC1740416.1 aromatic-ring-hydroxylating dioxygenase subunit beta [Schinkia azotoformans]MEC1745027.1 aromatic-ring-hydroxylating dioxygenase subunit beta [Schinkia azotoformans]MEC1756733.1 aromatic-ring-hydroxylating dioxygenase subunit beta [Schinkia azotoformans]MEC1768709.1 aromatic-ring-hydroxylating dioxygenase subunit be
MIKDSSKVSYYMNDEFYSGLLDGLKDWDTETGKATQKVCREIEQFLFRESRLVDDGKLEDWLDLFGSECLYWVPITPGGGNPLKEVSHAFDDRRRLEDRIYRLRTGYAYSQIPASRTLRMLSNIEVWKDGKEDLVRVRANFMLTELRAGKQKLYSGWNGYRMKKENGVWKINVKQVNLIDSDQGHENMTFIL